MSEFHPSVCPHDCPSVCALEVEKLPDGRLGKVRGSRRNRFTAGVICAKVARYHERFHHPERLGYPLRRKGPKGSGEFERIGWDDALDEIAEAFLRAEQRHGAETVWPYWYAGTMGLVQRDGIQRLTHAKRYSRFFSTICVKLSDTGFVAGHGKRWGVPATEIGEHSDLVVVWGTNPVHTHVNLMTHIARARKERGAKLVVVDPYRNATAEQADMHLALRPGTDGALACGVMHVLFKEGFADRDYLARYSDVPDELERHLASRTPEWAAAITGLKVEEILAFARLYGSDQAQLPAARLRLHPLAQRRRLDARRHLPAGRHRRLAARGRRGALQLRRPLPLRQDDDRGAGRGRPVRPHPRPVPHRPDPVRRPRRPRRRAAGHGAADPEHQPGLRRPRPRPRCGAASRATTCSSPSTSSS